MTDFLNLDHEINKYFSEDARNEADKKLYEFFNRIFTEARIVAVNGTKANEKIIITRDNWLEGYWSTIRSLRLKKRYHEWLIFTRMALFLIPIWIGYAFSDPKTMYWQIILGFILSAAIFIIAERLEDN